MDVKLNKEAATAQERKAQIEAKRQAREIKRLTQEATSIEVEPRFRKPVAYINELAPFLKVTLRLPEPGKDSVVDTVDIPLFIDPNNNLTAFTFNVTSAQDKSNMEISFTETDYALTELMLLRFRTLQNMTALIYLDVEFGWHAPAVVKNRYKDVMFTNTVTCTLDAYDVKMENGRYNVTLNCNPYTSNLPGKFRHLKPFNILGGVPFMTLALLDVVDQIEGESGINRFAKFLYDKKRSLKDVRDIIEGLLLLRDGSGSIARVKRNRDRIIKNLRSGIGDTDIDGKSLNTPELRPLRERDPDKIAGISRKLLEQTADLRVRIHQDPKIKKAVNLLMPYLQEKLIHPMDALFYAFETLRRQIELRPDLNRDVKIAQLNFLDSQILGLDMTFGTDADTAGKLERQLRRNRARQDRGRRNLSKASGKNSKRGIRKQLKRLRKKEKLITDNLQLFGMKAKDVVVTRRTSWQDFFTEISGKVRVISGKRPFETEKEQQSRLAKSFQRGDDDAKRIVKGVSTNNNIIKSKGSYAEYTSLKTNFFYSSAENAETILKTLDIMYPSLQITGRNRNFNDSGGKAKLDPTIVEDIKDELEKVKSAIQDRRSILMFTMSEMNTDGIFDPDVGVTNIIQAYSYRFIEDGEIPGQFDSARDKTRDINFPDVLSFNPSMDFFNAYSNIVASGGVEITNENGDQLIKTRLDNIDSAKERVKQLKARRKALRRNKKRNRNKIERNKADLDDARNSLNKQELDFEQSVYGLLPVRFKVDFGYSRVSEPGGKYKDAVQSKQAMQNLRKRLALTSNLAKAEMDVMGDPSYNHLLTGKYIFLWVYNPDGSMSPMTGVYNVYNIRHTMQAGDFRTTLDMAQTPSGGALRDELIRMFTGKDALVIQSKTTDERNKLRETVGTPGKSNVDTPDNKKQPKQEVPKKKLKLKA